MKHLTEAEVRTARRLVEEIGVRLEEEQLQTMLRHVDWLIETNQSINLSAVTTPEAAVRLHVIDSLLALPEVLQSPAGLLMDLGTGAGFPGLELCVAAGRPGLLVDSVRKKTAALNGFLMHENLDSWISVSGRRAEELATEMPDSVSVVTARAVAELPSLVELAAPLLQLGGVLVALKARPAEDELRRGVEAARLCGMEEVSVRRAVVPDGGELRTLVAYRRTGKARTLLPRRIGLAQNRPLA